MKRAPKTQGPARVRNDPHAVPARFALRAREGRREGQGCVRAFHHSHTPGIRDMTITTAMT